MRWTLSTWALWLWLKVTPDGRDKDLICAAIIAAITAAKEAPNGRD